MGRLSRGQHAGEPPPWKRRIPSGARGFDRCSGPPASPHRGTQLASKTRRQQYCKASQVASHLPSFHGERLGFEPDPNSQEKVYGQFRARLNTGPARADGLGCTRCILHLPQARYERRECQLWVRYGALEGRLMKEGQTEGRTSPCPSPLTPPLSLAALWPVQGHPCPRAFSRTNSSTSRLVRSSSPSQAQPHSYSGRLEISSGHNIRPSCTITK